MKKESSTKEGTVWEHLESLRWVLLRIIAVLLILSVVIFAFKDFIFNQIIFAACDNNFITYKALCRLAEVISIPELCPQIDAIELININLAAQLMVHLSTALYLAFIIGFPYIIVEVWWYVSPALYVEEKKPAAIGTISFIVLFYMGLLLSYYIIFPLTLNFLGNYQISERVPNQVSLNSYMSTLTTLSLMMGIVFEMPIVGYFFGKIGAITSEILKHYRKIAVVVVMVAAAMITPSTDIFTMMLVCLPLMMLYEFTIKVVKRTEKKPNDLP